MRTTSRPGGVATTVEVPFEGAALVVGLSTVIHAGQEIDMEAERVVVGLGDTSSADLLWAVVAIRDAMAAIPGLDPVEVERAFARAARPNPLRFSFLTAVLACERAGLNWRATRRVLDSLEWARRLTRAEADNWVETIQPKAWARLFRHDWCGFVEQLRRNDWSAGDITLALLTVRPDARTADIITPLLAGLGPGAVPAADGSCATLEVATSVVFARIGSGSGCDDGAAILDELTEAGYPAEALAVVWERACRGQISLPEASWSWAPPMEWMSMEEFRTRWACPLPCCTPKRRRRRFGAAAGPLFSPRIAAGAL